jgi:hypothetical protein
MDACRLRRAPGCRSHGRRRGRPPGEVAEFDTQVPHWFGSTGDEPAEILSLFGRHGERMHVRAKSGQDRLH